MKRFSSEMNKFLCNQFMGIRQQKSKYKRYQVTKVTGHGGFSAQNASVCGYKR